MFDQETMRRIATAAAASPIDPARLLAVCDVESCGVAAVDVNGRREPLIRFEAHYFDRLLSQDQRRLARRQGLASPVAGAIANPASQAARWVLLAAAAAIDHDAAYESASWGIGQVMGANWKSLGYESIDALVAEARASVEGQARLAILYIVRNRLVDMLEAGDWSGFAARYNGPDYRRNRYDEKLAAAFAVYDARLANTSDAAAAGLASTAGPSAGSISGNVESSSPAGSKKKQGVAAMSARNSSSSIKTGARGGDVGDLQRSLTALGHPVAADGMFGPMTRAALQNFQHANGLDPDGIAGPVTVAAIGRLLPAVGPSAARMAFFLGFVCRFLKVVRWFLGK